MLLPILLFTAIPTFLGLGLLIALEGRRESLHTSLLAPAFALGLGIWSWVSSLGYTYSWSLITVMIVYGMLTLLAWLAALRHQYRGDFEPYSSWHWLAIMTSVLIAVLLYYVGAHQDPSADTMRHLAIVRAILQHGALVNELFFFSPNEPYNLLNSAYVYNAIHVLYAAVATLTGAEPALMLFHEPAVIAFLLLIAHYWLARNTFEDRRTALVYVLIIILVWAAAGFQRWRTLSYPETIAYIAYIAWAGSLLRFIRQGSTLPTWLVFGMVTAGMVYVHSQWWLYAMITLSVGIVWCAFRNQWRQALSLTLFASYCALASAPLLLMRIPFYLPLAAEFGSILHGYFDNQLYHIGPLYGFNPFGRPISLWHGTSLLWALGSVFTLRHIHARTPQGIRLAAVISLAAYCLMITPLAMIISELFTTTLASRLFELVALWGGLATFYVLAERRAFLAAKWESWLPRTKKLALTAFIFTAFIAMLLYPLTKYFKEAYGLKNPIMVFVYPLLIAAGAGGSYLLVRRMKHVPLARLLFPSSRQFSRLYMFALAAAMLLPGSSLAPWQAWWSERMYAQLYGPLIEQVLASPDFQHMLAMLPDGAVVVTDQPSLLLAYRGIRVTGSVLGLTKTGKRLQAVQEHIYDEDTPAEIVYALARELGADYIVYTPRHSMRARANPAARPDLFDKIFDSVVTGITYGDGRYVVYRVRKDVQADAMAPKNEQNLTLPLD